MAKTYDFAGWATRANLLCSDGRTIRKDAFAECDGERVPLVWNHQHNSPEEVLGHADLENREEGVYAYCTFNDTQAGQNAKLLVQHGDVTQMSIFANKLKHQGSNVIHGVIREVSLVLAGANPGAYIESIMMHGDDSCEEGHIFTGEDYEYVAPLVHAEKSENSEKGENEMKEREETLKEIFDTLTPKQKQAVYALFGQILDDSVEGEVKHSNDEPASEEGDEETIASVFNSMTDKQKKVVYAIAGQIAANKQNADKEDEGGNDDMKHNVFDQETNNMETLSHSEMEAIFADARRNGSLRDSVLAHGIEDIDILFPDAKALEAEPQFIKRDDAWVSRVLDGVHHSPFTRIKTIMADITADEARAKGYVKGNQKLEQVFKLLKRVTGPTTIYKKQKLDRDDILDIKDLSIVPWLKAELRMMLNEELARAILIGDGRTELSEDKINEECIRPIWTMEDLFTVKTTVTVGADATSEEKARAFITACIKSRKNYKGSGNPVMFMPEDLLTDCLLIEDGIGHVMYDTVEKLAARLRVREIIPVPVMENQTRTADSTTYTLGGIYVNLKDYNIGTDKGGEVTTFSDFDIDYNQEKYLMETRCSGTLVKPYSAVAIEFVTE